MGCSVVTTAAFEARLDEALQYRSRFFGRRSARKVADRLETVVRSLATMPYMGAALEAHDSRGNQLRWVPVEQYIAVYVVHEDDGKVLLVDLFHAGQDWRATLEGR